MPGWSSGGLACESRRAVPLSGIEQVQPAVRHAMPPELHPGIDYAAFALDPDGHCIQLYYYMEQVGWDGRVRPASQRRVVQSVWPEALEPLSDTYVDQVFQGPLG